MLKHLNELFTLVEINLKIRYRQTIVGFLWVILNPIVVYFVQALLFSHLLGKSNIQYYFYLFSGLLPWFYFTQTVQMGCTYLKSNSGLIKNLKVHPFKLIAGLAAENYINLVCASLIVYLLIAGFNPEHLVGLAIYFAASLWLLVIVALFTFIAALLNILIKDTNYILHFVFTILYFLTPTFFMWKICRSICSIQSSIIRFTGLLNCSEYGI